MSGHICLITLGELGDLGVNHGLGAFQIYALKENEETARDVPKGTVSREIVAIEAAQAPNEGCCSGTSNSCQ